MKCLSGCEIAAILQGSFQIKTQGAQTLLHRHKAMHTFNFANAKISSTLHQLLTIWMVNTMNSHNFCRGHCISVSAQEAINEDQKERPKLLLVNQQKLFCEDSQLHVMCVSIDHTKTMHS